MAKNDFIVTFIFKFSLGFVRKMLSFVGIHLSFLPKRCLFIFCIFCLNEKDLNHQSCLIKYVENEISSSTSQKQKKKRKEQKHNLSSKTLFLKPLKNCH